MISSNSTRRGSQRQRARHLQALEQAGGEDAHLRAGVVGQPDVGEHGFRAPARGGDALVVQHGAERHVVDHARGGGRAWESGRCGRCPRAPRDTASSARSSALRTAPRPRSAPAHRRSGCRGCSCRRRWARSGRASSPASTAKSTSRTAHSEPNARLSLRTSRSAVIGGPFRVAGEALQRPGDAARKIEHHDDEPRRRRWRDAGRRQRRRDRSAAAPTAA